MQERQANGPLQSLPQDTLPEPADPPKRRRSADFATQAYDIHNMKIHTREHPAKTSGLCTEQRAISLEEDVHLLAGTACDLALCMSLQKSLPASILAVKKEPGPAAPGLGQLLLRRQPLFDEVRASRHTHFFVTASIG